MNEESLIINILEEAREKIQEEISGLLGRTLTLEKPRIRQISKGDFFSEAKKKVVLTRIAVEGDLAGEVYLFTPLRDAILLGGTLIMLPPSELESRIKREEFGEEEDDAFGEIANIIAGVINNLFEESYPQKLRFKKTALQPLNMSKTDPAATDPFPPQNFLQGTFSMKLEEQTLGTLDVLLPTLLFAAAADPTETPPLPSPPPATEKKSSPPLVLIIADQGCDMELNTLAATLRENGFETVCLGFQDDPKGFLQDKEACGIFLIMKEVAEQGFAAAIRVRSVTQENIPLIAAGPQWTRKTVLQAVKFGIRDILVTPATRGDVQEKITSYLTFEKSIS